jgi:hypothetical protein
MLSPENANLKEKNNGFNQEQDCSLIFVLLRRNSQLAKDYVKFPEPGIVGNAYMRSLQLFSKPED